MCTNVNTYTKVCQIGPTQALVDETQSGLCLHCLSQQWHECTSAPARHVSVATSHTDLSAGRGIAAAWPLHLTREGEV